MTLRLLGRDLEPRHLTEAAVVVTSVIALWTWGVTQVGDARVDDAYITFAYSKNLAQGNGAIYGHDLRVEGYSNFLWMVLASLGELFGPHAMATARFFSHAFFAATVGSTWWVARRFGGPIAGALAALCLASSGDMYRAIQSGLETVGYSGFIALGLAHYVTEDPKRRRWSLAWLSGAALMRIDGFVPLLLFAALEGLRWLLDRERARLRVALTWLGIGVLPVACYWLWRATYYGLPFPLTYYAKASMGIEAENWGIDYLWNGVRDTGVWIALLIGSMGLLRSKLNYLPLQFLAFVAVFAGYVVHVGGDWMPFNRMLLPLLAPLFMVMGAGIGALVESLREATRPAQALAAVVVVAAVGVLCRHQSDYWVDTPHEKGKLGNAAHVKSHTENLVKTIPFVRAMIRKPGDVLVTDYGGVFAYGTDASVIEMWGLANREIALRGNTDGINGIYGKTCVPCYAEFDPDYFHSVVPLLRPADAFTSKHALIGQIFQGRAIDKVIGLRKNFVLGRVLRARTNEALWFLERKREGRSLAPRRVGEFVIDYFAEPDRARRQPRK